MSSNYRSILNVQGSSFENTKSIALDGVDDYVDVGRITSLENTSSFSFSMWLYPTSYTGVRTLLGRAPSGTDMFYAYTQNSNGYVYFHVANGQTNYPRVVTSSSITLNTWGLLTFVYDGSLSGNLNRAKIYINGVLASTSTTAALIPSATSSDTSNFYFGRTNYASSPTTQGIIDEVSAYNYSLSASDITTIYNSGVPNNLNDLSIPPVSWWRCGDGDTAPTLLDNGSGGNNGTMTNFSTFSTDVPT